MRGFLACPRKKWANSHAWRHVRDRHSTSIARLDRVVVRACLVGRWEVGLASVQRTSRRVHFADAAEQHGAQRQQAALVKAKAKVKVKVVMSCSTVVDLDTDIPTDRGTLGKGHMVFTGPDSHRNHRMTRLDGAFVGNSCESPENTADLNYLYRGPEEHIPARKSNSIPYGSIGWGVPKKQDFRVMESGHQIKIGEPGPFRQRNEDRYTHRLQEPFYPKPVVDAPKSPRMTSAGPKSARSRPQLTQRNLHRLDSVGSTASVDSSRPGTAQLQARQAAPGTPS